MVLSIEDGEQPSHRPQVAGQQETLTQLSFPLSVSEMQRHCHQSLNRRDVTVWQSRRPGLTRGKPWELGWEGAGWERNKYPSSWGSRYWVTPCPLPISLRQESNPGGCERNNGGSLGD